MEYARDILLGNDVIGTAIVSREGLYYCIRCTCALTGEVVFKIIAQCGDRSVSLGVCVPKNDAFGLEKRIPVKQLGDGRPVFMAVPNHQQMTGKFVPLRPEEPFAYIERLQNAYLEKRGEILGAILAGE